MLKTRKKKKRKVRDQVKDNTAVGAQFHQCLMAVSTIAAIATTQAALATH